MREINEIIIRRGKFNPKPERADLIEIHKIRGRLLHLTSILEAVMKGYCDLPPNTKKTGIGNRKKITLKNYLRNLVLI